MRVKRLDYMAGRLRGEVRRLLGQKDMAFTSLNGNVDVTLPPSTKANLRLRSDRGDVYSDFDVQCSRSRRRRAGKLPQRRALSHQPDPVGGRHHQRRWTGVRAADVQ